jgi:hypothetical protein
MGLGASATHPKPYTSTGTERAAARERVSAFHAERQRYEPPSTLLQLL